MKRGVSHSRTPVRRVPDAAPVEESSLSLAVRKLSHFLTPLVQPPDTGVQRWHYVLIALIPAVLTLLNANWLFENGPHMDPWYYFGHFQHFPRFHNLNPEYPGERIVWILPGYLLSHLLGQVPGVIALHVLTFLTCLFAFHFILVRLTDGPTALLSTMLLGCNAYFIGPNGWDFLEAQSWMFLLLSFALVIPRHPRREWMYLTLSSMAWFGMIYGYVAWAVFTPAYLYVVLRFTKNDRNYWRAGFRVVGFFVVGGILATLGCWGTYAAMGGHGFFFAANLQTAIHIGVKLTDNPWLDPTWTQRCTWLILPAVAFLLAAAGTLVRFRRKDGENAVLGFHIFAFVLMVAWTFRPYRILAWDYRASIMLPGLFLVFALLVFRVPRNATRLEWLALTAFAAGLSVAPLGFRYLVLNPPPVTIVLIYCGALVVLGCWRVFRPSGRFVWGTMVFLFPWISMAIMPPYTTTAWRQDYKGYDISERVSRAISLISSRIPRNVFPVFWVSGFERSISSESRAVTCAFFTQAFSMWYFPQVTLPPVNRVPPVGSRVFLMTEDKDAPAGASYNIARAGMPVELLSQDRLQYGDTSYWITQLQILPPALVNIRRGFASAGPVTESPFTLPASGMRRRRFVASQTGIYQFELSGIPSGTRARFGALLPDGLTFLDDAGPPIVENGISILWFRLALKIGETADLGLEIEAAPAVPAHLKLAILRDADPSHTVESFDHLVERPSGNLLANGGFQDGNALWYCIRGVVRPSRDCYYGACMEYAGSSMSQSAIQKVSVPLAPGAQYHLGAWLKVQTVAAQPMIMGVWDETSEQWIASQKVTVTPSWNHYQIPFTAKTNHPVSVRFQNTETSPATVVLDEVVLAASDDRH